MSERTHKKSNWSSTTPQQDSALKLRRFTTKDDKDEEIQQSPDINLSKFSLPTNSPFPDSNIQRQEIEGEKEEGEETPGAQLQSDKTTSEESEEEIQAKSEEPNQEIDEAVQTKLTVGQPGDKYEQEADTVAAKVVEQINLPQTNQPVQGKIEPVAKPTVMRQGAAAGGAVNQDVEQNIQQARGSGQELAENVRQPMEQAFGADFSGVKVHTDGQADVLNRSLNSRAFATGQDIFFKQGEYQPQSKQGQELLAHELTHVVQQGGHLSPTRLDRQQVEGSDDRQFLADKIRRQFSKGIMLAFSIPDAYVSEDEAETLPRDKISSYSWKRVLSIISKYPEFSGYIQPLWLSYRKKYTEIFGEYDEEQEHEERNRQIAADRKRIKEATQGKIKLTPEERRQLLQQIRKRKKEAKKLAKARHSQRRLPQNYVEGTSGQQAQIRQIIWENNDEKIKNDIWQEYHKKLAFVEWNNNRTFSKSARSFARSHGAIGISEGQIRIGQEMIYHSPEEITSYATEVHTRVLALLRQYPATYTNKANPENIAQIKYLTIFAHGSSGWIGGHGGAESAKFRTRDVNEIVAGLSNILAPDVRLRLFACSTAKAPKQTSAETAGEGSIADAFRDALITEHDGAMVIGHINSGNAVGNTDIRVFSGNTGISDEFAVDRSTNLDKVFPSEFVISEAIRLGIAKSEKSLKKKTKRQLREAMRRFYSAQGWLLESFGDIESGSQEIWRKIRQRWQDQIKSQSIEIRRLRRK